MSSKEKAPDSQTSVKPAEDVIDATREAWQLAFRQMSDIGQKAMKSGSVLAETFDEDVQIAESPSELVYRIDKVTLSRYLPMEGVEPSGLPPIVICYGLFGRQTMIDLQVDRSLVRNLLAAGIEVYVVDWGSPSRADQYLSFDDYVDDYLGGCIERIAELKGQKPVLFGICEGGTFGAAYAALYPQHIAGLMLAITPIDFHGKPESFKPGEGFINTWVANLDAKDIEEAIDLYGMLPGAFTGALFSSLTAVNSMTKYNYGLAALEGDRDAIMNFLRMEKWIADRPDHPGTAAKQWLNELYRENKLVRGEFEIGGRKVDLTRIECPVINIYALKDHIIPISCSQALGDYVDPALYEEIGFPGGHIGVFVSGKAQGVVAGGIIKWMQRQFTGKKTSKGSKSRKKQAS